MCVPGAQRLVAFVVGEAKGLEGVLVIPSALQEALQGSGLRLLAPRQQLLERFSARVQGPAPLLLQQISPLNYCQHIEIQRNTVH